MTTAHGKPQKRALFFRLHFSLLTPRFLHRILRRVFTRFPRGKKYVRHILKQVGHILKYKAHIFSLLSCGCNALKKSFRFSAQKSCCPCLRFLYGFRPFTSRCHEAETYAPAAARFHAVLRYRKTNAPPQWLFLQRGVKRFVQMPAGQLIVGYNRVERKAAYVFIAGFTVHVPVDVHVAEHGEHGRGVFGA